MIYTGIYTEACKQGLHGKCNGTGIDIKTQIPVQCECLCHGKRDEKEAA